MRCAFLYLQLHTSGIDQCFIFYSVSFSFKYIGAHAKRVDVNGFLIEDCFKGRLSSPCARTLKTCLKCNCYTCYVIG